MIYAEWTFSIAALCIGLFISAMNWMIFINNYVLKRKWSSAVPIVGGFCIAVGLFVLPLEWGRKYAFLPFFLDWGSIPVILFSLIGIISGRRS